MDADFGTYNLFTTDVFHRVHPVLKHGRAIPQNWHRNEARLSAWRSCWNTPKRGVVPIDAVTRTQHMDLQNLGFAQETRCRQFKYLEVLNVHVHVIPVWDCLSVPTEEP